MHVIGTAGHVDHGKSALVRALTGIDPDRLEEEKRRGLTIDLGFAWLKLPSGREVGVVDVPGHERFIKNMLAGVGAINATIFVVAANEGWKPQSQEHLDILDLLSVSSAVIAITKSDTAEEEQLEQLRSEILTRVSATSLRNASIVSVSALTGSGLPELITEIEGLLEAAPPAEDRGRPRLWIDRVFTVAGSGTVVTGTLVDGTLSSDSEVEILPEGLRSRVRSIQSHQRQLNEIGPGNRTALNLVGLERLQLERGHVVTTPGVWPTTRNLAATLRFLPSLPHDPMERGTFKFYIGSAEIDARLRFVGKTETPDLALVALAQESVIDVGDRFILRDAGRRETLGGGIVIDPLLAPKVRRTAYLEQTLRRRVGADRLGTLKALLEERGFLEVSRIHKETGVTPDEAKQVLAEAVWSGNVVVSTKTFNEFSERSLEMVTKHHAANPLEQGLPRALVRKEFDLPDHVSDALAEEMARRGLIVVEGTAMRSPQHSALTDTPEIRELLLALTEAGASPPTISELTPRFDRKVIHALIRSGELEEITSDIVYPVSTLEALRKQIAEAIKTSGPMTVAQLRDLVGTTRKYAVPLLEYLDRTGFTRREADVRVLGPRSNS
jgi:selenocysteine-specific elongation factor